MAPVRFGCLSDGQPVHALRLATANGLDVEILTYGATVRSLKAPSRLGLVETIIGFDTLGAYENDRTYQACVIGRTVNRMAGGRFQRDGQTWQVTQNEGPNHLHGGARGLTRRVWQAGARQADSDPIVLRYMSPAGEEGYPGVLQATIRFSLPDPLTLEIVYAAEVDAPCPVDLTHHLYFNLGQGVAADVLNHQLSIQGEGIIEVDDAFLATGQCLSVRDTLFDLRRERRLGDVLAERHPQLTAIGLNQAWVADRHTAAGIAARLSSHESGIALDLSSDQPSLQVWSGLSRDIARGGALALEPQGFIDAVNHPAFPTAWLEPGQVYQRTTAYRFLTL